MTRILLPGQDQRRDMEFGDPVEFGQVRERCTAQYELHGSSVSATQVLHHGTLDRGEALVRNRACSEIAEP